jgi:hypothetical protein
MRDLSPRADSAPPSPPTSARLTAPHYADSFSPFRSRFLFFFFPFLSFLLQRTHDRVRPDDRNNRTPFN